MNGSGESPPAVPAHDAKEKCCSLEGVSKTFGKKGHPVTALDHVDFTAEKGVITGLVGPDGAGKTTLMRLLMGLLKPDTGQIRVMGKAVEGHQRDIQRQIGYMPQQFGLYEDLSLLENLTLFADLHGVPQSARKDKYAELMQMTRLDQFTGRLAGRLSGGMKQKLGLACTLIRDPELLILDEPTAGVDPVSRRELWDIIGHLVEQAGMSVLLSTAYLDEAERCHDVAVFHNGGILDFGRPEHLSKSLNGKTFAVKTDKMGKRQVQARILKSDRVVDAVIVGDAVRIITADGRMPEAEAFGVPADTDIRPIPPRFEDAYVALMNEQGQGRSLFGHGDTNSASAAKRQNIPVPGDDAAVSDTSAEKAYGAANGLHRSSGEGHAVIETDHIRKRFGEFYAVKDLTFDVKQGEVFGLLGANGAGKTTTFRMLCGLLPVTEGKLRVAGEDLRTAAARARAKIGYMSQKFSLYGQLTVAENLDFFSSAYQLRKRRKKERMQWAMERFDLEPVADKPGNDLPLGYKQRLALACALMHEPEILFLDEPTSGVDPMARRAFWNQINRLSENGVTVLVTTHFMEEAEYCDRLVLMMAGEILALGSPSEVKKQAGTRTRKEVGSMEEAFIALMEGNDADENA